MAEPLVTQIDFLRLLTTQLEYQNPLDPVDNAEFIGQMAQFSNLQQVINLNENFIKFTNTSNNNFATLNTYTLQNQALSLLDKQIDFIDPLTGNSLSGKVQKVKFVGGLPLITVVHPQGTSEIGLEAITTVYA